MAYGLTKSLDLERSSTQHADVADHADFDLATTWTIEAWAKFESLPASGEEWTIVGKWQTSGDQRSYVVRLRNVSGSLYWEIVTDSDGAAGGASVYTTGARSLSTDTWYHIAFVVNASTPAIYEDGVSVGSSGSFSTPKSGSASLCVGSERTDGTAAWDGKLSLVRIWSTARSSTELADSQCSVLGATTGLLAEWTLNDTYADNSGNGHTLTAVGSPVFAVDVPTVCASVDVTVSATVVTATFSTPAPSISGNANVAQGTPPSATFSTPAPAISGGATVSPNALTATFSLPAPNIITPDAQIDASVVTATFSLPAPAVSGDANVPVGVQTLTFSLPASSVQIDAIIDAAVQVATFSTPAPTVTAIGNVSITASVVTATFNTNSPTITAEQNAIAEPSVLTATFSIPTPTITAIRNISVDVSVVTATFSVNTPTKVGGLWTAQPRVEGTWTPQARAV